MVLMVKQQPKSSQAPEPVRQNTALMWFMVVLGLFLLTFCVALLAFQEGVKQGMLFNAEQYFEGRCGFLPPLK